MTLAYLTGGQYVPMVNAKLLAQVIIGGVREEISLERLMKDAEADIQKEMEQAAAEGANEEEITSRVNRLLLTKNLRVKQMDNIGGTTSSAAKERYSKCVDMKELRSHYQPETPPEPVYHSRMAARAVYRRRAAAGKIDSDEKEEETTDFAPPPAAAAKEMSYDLKEDEVVSMAQTERIVQRMRYKK